MTSEEVLRLHSDGFRRASQQHDIVALEAIYLDRYMLARPDGNNPVLPRWKTQIPTHSSRRSARSGSGGIQARPLSDHRDF